MAKILLTGADGQLGHSLRKLASNYSSFEFVYTDVAELDITDALACNRFMQTEKPDFIINCAAYTAVDRAEEDSGTCFRLNADAVCNLNEAAKAVQARLIHISTDYVFSGRHYLPYGETDIPDPESVYGQSKLKGEDRIRDEDHVLIIRTSWLYSVYGHNFFKTMHRLTSDKEEVRVIYDQTGTPTWATDLARAIMQIVTSSLDDHDAFVPGIFHFSSEGIASWYDFAREIGTLSGHEARIVPVETSEFPLPAPRPFYSVLNKRKIKEIYHIDIPHWKDSLSACIEEFNTITN